MSDSPDAPELNKKLREALRKLPQIKAPWYFEARLQQKIRGDENKTAKKAFRPIPAFATLTAVIVCTGIFGYLVFLSPKDPSVMIENEPVQSSDASTVPSTTPQVIIVPAEPGNNAGPNVGNDQGFIESGIVGVVSEDSVQKKDSTLKIGADSTILGK